MDLPPLLNLILVALLLWGGNVVWERLTRQRCGARVGIGMKTCRTPVARRPGERCPLHPGMPVRRWP